MVRSSKMQIPATSTYYVVFWDFMEHLECKKQTDFIRYYTSLEYNVWAYSSSFLCLWLKEMSVLHVIQSKLQSLAIGTPSQLIQIGGLPGSFSKQPQLMPFPGNQQ